MYTDESGRLWIGTTNGLNLFDETNEIFFMNVAVSLGAIIYFLTLIRKMPFTKSRVIVTYSFPESGVKSSTIGKTPSEQIMGSEEESKE